MSDDLNRIIGRAKLVGFLTGAMVMCFVIGAICLLLACLGGCVTAHEAAGLRADIEHVAGQVNELGLTVGDVTLQGGEGDSITMWILAAGAAIVYPIVWRPIRKTWKLERRNGKG